MLLINMLLVANCNMLLNIDMGYPTLKQIELRSAAFLSLFNDYEVPMQLNMLAAATASLPPSTASAFAVILHCMIQCCSGKKAATNVVCSRNKRLAIGNA